MSKLSTEQFNRARAFIFENGRPLEQALFQYEFEQGDKNNVIEQMKKFQNEDGGFGHGLEPDIRCKASSALATTVALQILSTLKLTSDSDIIAKAIHYLLFTAKKSEVYFWDIVPPEVELAARAPWWNYDANRAITGNPNAEILGYLYEYKDIVPPNKLSQLTDSVFSYIIALDKAEFHELLCFIRLYERLPEALKQQIEHKLNDFIIQNVETDEQKWEHYCLQPHQIAPSPQSAFSYLFNSKVEHNLRYILKKQAEQGCWNPAWSWGQYEDEWLIAKRDWQGILTLDHLRLFKQYSLIN